MELFKQLWGNSYMNFSINIIRQHYYHLLRLILLYVILAEVINVAT